jgi:Tfp pilus assembly protein FimT
MLISLAIFAVVTAFVTANFRAGRQGDELRIAGGLAATALRRAQTLAVSGQTVLMCDAGANADKVCAQAADCPSGSCVRRVPPGYGIRFTTVDPQRRMTVLFADGNGNAALDAGEEMRTDSLSPGVFVSVTSVDPDVSGVLDVVFSPPKPTVTYNGSTAQAVASVVITHSTTGQSRTVTINRVSGQISEE